MKMRLIDNATIMPFSGSLCSFSGGIFTSDGDFIEDSIVERGQPAKLQKTVDYLSGTYIYGGCLFSHFGHFILESLSRLYMIRRCKEYPIIFITNTDSVFQFQKDHFRLLGVNNEIIRIKKPTSIERLIYSPPGSSINPLYITEEQINSLKYLYFPENAKRTKEKIWLSRSKLFMGMIINEEAIEKILIKIGYKIIHPEILPLLEQIKLISTSEIVAGFDGSQFFSLLFALDISSKFHIFNRRPNIPKAIPYVLQKRNVEFNLHNFDIEYVCGEGAWSYYLHREPEKIVETLRDL